jgi:hypothetical protein
MPNNERAKIPRATQDIACETTSVVPARNSSVSAFSNARFLPYQRDTAEIRYCGIVPHQDAFHA